MMNPMDRRVIQIILTPEGEALQEPVSAVIQTVNNEILSRFTPEGNQCIAVRFAMLYFPTLTSDVHRLRSNMVSSEKAVSISMMNQKRTGTQLRVPVFSS